MNSFKSHLSVLEASAAKYPSRHAFQIAKAGSNSSVDAWAPVTFREFLEDVEVSARYWYKTLSDAGLSQGSVVGLWYVLVHIPDNATR
jgi:acyl-CoA synthetase (AMP-forming)/AMP-acid ligase II